MINNPVIIKKGGGQGNPYLDLANVGTVAENNEGIIPVILSELTPNTVAVYATEDAWPNFRVLLAWKVRANEWDYQYYSSNGVRLKGTTLNSNDEVFPWPVNPEGVYEHNVAWYLGRFDVV